MHIFRGHGLKWLGICLLFFVPLISLSVLEQQVQPLKHAFQSDSSNFDFRSHDGEWRPFDPVLHGREKMSGTYWFRTTLPDNHWRDPHMYLTYVPNAEIYLEDSLIYTFAPQYEIREHPHLIRLPDDFSGQTLLIRIDFHHQFIHPGVLVIDSQLNLVAEQIIKSSYRLLLGLVTFLISIVGFLLYSRRREASYLYFSLFALYIAQLCVARSWFLFGLLTSSPLFTYIQDVILALGAYCFLRFYEAVFGAGPYRILRRLSQAMLILSGLLLITTLAFPTFHLESMAQVMQNAIAPLVMVIIMGSAIRTYWQRRDAESFWFMAGFVTVGVSTLFYFLQPFIYWIADKMTTDSLPLTSLVRILYDGDRFLHGIFILFFCMVMTLGERIRSIYRKAQQTAEELAQLSGSLEQLVQERTRALEQTNQNLRSSMQETAAALAEVAVLEDRNRIAQDMHDRAGHSLTAALIQIEAVKMIAQKDMPLALQKLDSTRESIASGLDSIRETVRMMRLDYEERSLVPAIQKLIQETQQATGIRVIYDPKPLPDLNTVLKKTLYLALQEGLTNGIRHGKATRFDFSLEVVDDAIRFELANDGEPYASQEFGFGLNTMRERLERLNGTMNMASTDAHACVLSIEVPLESDDGEGEDQDDSDHNRG